MTGDDRPDAPQELWRSQPSEHFQMSIEELHMRMNRIERQLRRRTLLGFLNCAFLAVFFALWWSRSANHVEQTGAVLIVAAVAYLGWDLIRNRPRLSTADRTADHLRAELLRQRNFHRGAPFVTRLVFLFSAAMVFFTGFAMAHPEIRRPIIGEAIAAAVLTLIAIPVNLRLAAKFQRELDRIEAVQGDFS